MQNFHHFFFGNQLLRDQVQHLAVLNLAENGSYYLHLVSTNMHVQIMAPERLFSLQGLLTSTPLSPLHPSFHTDRTSGCQKGLFWRNEFEIYLMTSVFSLVTHGRRNKKTAVGRWSHFEGIKRPLSHLCW